MVHGCSHLLVNDAPLGVQQRHLIEGNEYAVYLEQKEDTSTRVEGVGIFVQVPEDY